MSSGMGYRCQYCDDLSIECLVNLAKKEFAGHEFPTTAYYQHHSSFGDMDRSARAGCDLCQLIIECFKGIRWEPGESLDFTSESWEGPECDIEASAYAVAMKLDVSDVKLCINTDHLYMEELLENVRVFNTLLVQVGTQELPDDGCDYPFPFLAFALSTPLNKIVEEGGFRIGRFHVDPDLRSSANFAIARSWLNECQTTHRTCLKKVTPELPKRVIDIGPLDSPITPRIFMPHDVRSDYVVLSHSWGGNIPTMLTTKTYDEYQRTLPYSELPANFRDTLEIAKELGIRYVWVDSLCIIQDSKDDWASESKKMGGIYRNATLAISALVSENSTVGILKTSRDYTLGVPSRAGIRVLRDKAAIEEVRVEWKPFEEENLRRLALNSPHSRRAWTLQEFVLSPRNLLYGHRQIYWRCPSQMKSADGTPEGNQFPDSSFQVASGVIYSDILASKPDKPVDINTLLTDYYELAEGYSARKLTFGSDKLPAFAGIASSLQLMLGGDYLAGLWTTDLKRGLLWQADLSFCRHVKTHGAPSWSWMVTGQPILFPKKATWPGPYGLELVQYEVMLRDPTNPFGPIDYACIAVKGLAVPLKRSTQVARCHSRDELIFGYINYDEPLMENDNAGRNSIFRMDNGDSSPSFVSMYTEMGSDDVDVDPSLFSEGDLLLLLVQIEEDVDGEKGNNFGEGLAIRRVPDQPEDTYERIGYAMFWRPKVDWFRTWQTRVLNLV